MKYKEELNRAMEWLGKKPDTLFLGQAVGYDGTAMTNTIKGVSDNKKLEMPVNEDMQMGMSIGMALNGTVPISIYPRWNFLVLASNQIVNHLDKIKLMSDGGFTPKVIIRTSIGSQRPLHPQFQHIGDFSDAIQSMCTTIEVIKLNTAEKVFKAYKKAYESKDGKNSILVEYGDYYHEK